MLQHSNLKNAVTFVSITALLFALSTAVAQARGVGITDQSIAQQSAPPARAAASPADKPAMPVQAETVIVADLPIQVSASEAADLLDDLLRQLAAQPDARLSIHWRLTRPAEMK